MSISKTMPHPRLRFIVLAVLAAASTTVLFAPAGSGLGVQDAFAHGSCSNNINGPFKTNAGRIAGSAAYVCTGNHATTSVCVQIVFDTGSGAFTPVDEPACRNGDANSTTSKRAYVSAACAGTGVYRVMAVGTATNQSGQVAHQATDNTGGTRIQCAADDLASTGGVFEDINALLATLL